MKRISIIFILALIYFYSCLEEDEVITTKGTYISIEDEKIRALLFLSEGDTVLWQKEHEIRVSNKFTYQNERIIEYGYCWAEADINSSPTLADFKIQLGTEIENNITFAYTITGLKANTRYAIRSYFKTISGITGYFAKPSVVFTQQVEKPYITKTNDTLPIYGLKDIDLICNMYNITVRGTIVSIKEEGWKIIQHGHICALQSYKDPLIITSYPPYACYRKSTLGKLHSPAYFDSYLSGLQSNSLYKIRSYIVAENPDGDKQIGYFPIISDEFRTKKIIEEGTFVDIEDEYLNIVGQKDTLLDATAYYALVQGTLKKIGVDSIIEYGHCWSETNVLPFENARSQYFVDTIIDTPYTFSTRLTDLKTNTQYYVRSYVKTQTGKIGYNPRPLIIQTNEKFAMKTVNDNCLNICTEKPIVSVISDTQASASTIFLKLDSDNSIVQHGYCWASKNNPLKSDAHSALGNLSYKGEMQSIISGLQPDTEYYIRAYVQTQNGQVAYSEDTTFRTTGNDITNTWITGQPFTSPRTGAVGFSIRGKGYIATGYEIDSCLNDVWEYDALLKTWSFCSEMQDENGNNIDYGRMGGIAAVINDSIALIGLGKNKQGYLDDLYLFNPATTPPSWKKLASLPQKISNATAFTLNDKVYVVGGETRIGNYSEKVWEYSLETDQWQQKENNFPVAFIDGIAFVVNNIAYVGTGQSGSGEYVKKLWIYKPKSDTWEETLSLNNGQTGAFAFTINNSAYIFGGLTNNGDTDALWVFDGSEITSVNPTDDFKGIPRHNAAGFVIDNRAYIGTGIGYNICRDFYIYTPPVNNQ